MEQPDLTIFANAETENLAMRLVDAFTKQLPPLATKVSNMVEANQITKKQATAAFTKIACDALASTVKSCAATLNRDPTGEGAVTQEMCASVIATLLYGTVTSAQEILVFGDTVIKNKIGRG